MIGYPAEEDAFLSGFVQGQGQKSEQKHETKKLVEFHNQPTSINYGHSYNVHSQEPETESLQLLIFASQLFHKP